jgi:hypothetical protein
MKTELLIKGSFYIKKGELSFALIKYWRSGRDSNPRPPA